MTITRRELDFAAARRRLESKSKAAGDKLVTIDAAVARVADGDHVAVGGCLYSRTPLALVRALLRRRPRGLALSRNLMCYEGEWALVAGAVDKLVTSWMGIGLPWGLSRILREYVESGRVVFEEWSHLGLGLRFRAAAMGLPFLPSLTMLGSDLMGVGGSKAITCPYTGETLHAVPALFPDVALLHVHRADRLGNCQIDGYPHMDADIALAAATVLVSAEEIVPEEEIRRRPDRTVIPGFAVDALVHVPYGAYPHEVYGVYDAEPEHFTWYVDGIREHGAEGVARYLDRFVHGPATHAEYLDLFGDVALASARDRARSLTR
jgi:glutaconate CoA-transferase subunit A